MDDDTNDASLSDLEWQNRVLCSDESCIGTIGKDGRCTECGRPYEGQLPATENDGAAQASGKSVQPEQSIAPAPSPQDGEAPEESDPDWENRTLCPDESCIGVIGPDGRCKECGRSLT